MIAIPYTNNMYNMLCEWWAAHKWHPVPEEALPPTGFTVYNGPKPIMAGFVYKTDSTVGIFEWIISNPESDKLERDEAFPILVDSVIKYAIMNGSKVLFTSVNHPSLIKKLEGAGFVKTDTNMINMLRVL